MANRRFTKDQMEYMMERHKSDAGVAKHLGVTRQSVQQQRIKLGVKSRLDRIPMRNEYIIKLYDHGVAVYDLSHRVGLSIQTINKVLKSRKAKDAV